MGICRCIQGGLLVVYMPMYMPLYCPFCIYGAFHSCRHFRQFMHGPAYPLSGLTSVVAQSLYPCRLNACCLTGVPELSDSAYYAGYAYRMQPPYIGTLLTLRRDPCIHAGSRPNPQVTRVVNLRYVAYAGRLRAAQPPRGCGSR